MKRGFTLLEVVVALTIAGVVALAARAALSGGIDTQERLQAHASRTEGDARFRALLVIALRHMTDAPAAGLVPFILRDTILSQGGHSHAAEFYSRGLSHPAGSGPTLRIQLVPSDTGLTIHALDAQGSTRLRGVAPGVVGVRMRMYTPAGDWVDAWPRTLQVPKGVVVEFTTRPSALPPPPLVVTAGLEGKP